jgi:hypothetical protein
LFAALFVGFLFRNLLSWIAACFFDRQANRVKGPNKQRFACLFGVFFSSFFFSSPDLAVGFLSTSTLAALGAMVLEQETKTQTE